MVRFGTYNLQGRRESAQAVMARLDVDVRAVQEIAAGSHDHAAGELAALADALGMTAYYQAPWVDDDGGDVGRLAIAVGAHDLGVGLMWAPARVQALPATFRAYEEPGLWHAIIKGTFVVRGDNGTDCEIQHASCHLGPFGTQAIEARRVVSALTRPDRRPPGLVGADWNCVGADRLPDGSYFDPDPYRDRPWHDAFVYGTRWWYEPGGERRWEADRVPGDVLYAGGLLDAAAELHQATGAPWRATTGHWPDANAADRMPRRIDGIRVTREVADALQSCETDDSDLAREASDHLPVVVSYDPAAITAHRARLA